MDVDQVFHLVGEIGPQQIVYFVYASIIGGVFVSGQMLQITFTGATPEYKCWDGDTILRNRCDKENACQGLTYTSHFTSIVTEVRSPRDQYLLDQCVDFAAVRAVQPVFSCYGTESVIEGATRRKQALLLC